MQGLMQGPTQRYPEDEEAKVCSIFKVEHKRTSLRYKGVKCSLI